MNIKPQKGMQEYLPEAAALRDRLTQTILETYTGCGFTRIYTPAVESAENLDKSDGGDNLNLIFKILKRGEKLAEALGRSPADEKELCDLGLRYDLTLPLSRYYANNRNSLPNPFKCIQIDKVYRAERPQRGRLREFVQCDIDILGSDSICCEIELISVTAKALSRLGIGKFFVRVNDRRILRSSLMTMGFPEDALDTVSVTFDKLDKIGADGVAAELREKRMPEGAVEALRELLGKDGITLDDMAAYCKDEAALTSLRTIIGTADKLSPDYSVIYDPSLVRGQGYYTGTVFEVASEKFGGTIAGGGRYDGLIGRFTGENIPAVGFSIGFERIFSIVSENNVSLGGRRSRTAILYKEEDILEAISKSAELEAGSDVTLVLVPNPKKCDKIYSRTKNQGFDEIIKLNM
ncbi:MAG: ATP phosphoribosyltransferase regulatory subunit [Ruminiclostridium sp.]|nr:ATP phosphoribosyltransferase regulatory subunit [Ruminiclostridium sp.]